MALTTEQQQQVDMSNAIEDHRMTGMSSIETKRVKLQAVQQAQQILIENRKYESADSVTPITANDVTTLADSLVTYINS